MGLLNGGLLSTSVIVSFVSLRFLESGKLERMGKNATETFKMLTVAFGVQAIGKAGVLCHVQKGHDRCLRC
jgi:hypothetical protein